MVAIVKECHGAKYILVDIDGAKEKGKLLSFDYYDVQIYNIKAIKDSTIHYHFIQIILRKPKRIL